MPSVTHVTTQIFDKIKEKNTRNVFREVIIMGLGSSAATSEEGKQSIKVNVIEISGASEVTLILKKESHDPQCQRQLSSFMQPMQQNNL